MWLLINNQIVIIGIPDEVTIDMVNVYLFVTMVHDRYKFSLSP